MTSKNKISAAINLIADIFVLTNIFGVTGTTFPKTYKVKTYCHARTRAALCVPVLCCEYKIDILSQRHKKIRHHIMMSDFALSGLGLAQMERFELSRHY